MRIDGGEIERLSKSSGVRMTTSAGLSVNLPAPANNRTTSVSLSADAQQVRDLREAVDQAPSLQASRVESLRRQVQDGSYRVESSKLARVMDRVLQ